MLNIFDYDQQMLERYRNPTLRDKMQNLAFRVLIDVSRPIRHPLYHLEIRLRNWFRQRRGEELFRL